MKIVVLFFRIAPTRLQTTELVDESDIDRWAAEIDPPPSSGWFFFL